MYAYRTRFAKDIVAEFYPPAFLWKQLRSGRASPRKGGLPGARKKPKEDKVIIFCSGQPGMPSGHDDRLLFWAKKGHWTFRFRYRGTWESGGKFLRRSPEQDVLDIIDDLTKKKCVVELFGHKRLVIRPAKIFLFGSSFGGPAAILASHDPCVAKTVAFSPVVDWKYQATHGETNEWTRRFTREAFGGAYRFSDSDWKKLGRGNFYDPMSHAKNIDGRKLLILQAKDDKIVPPGPVKKFARATGAKLWLLPRGGHVPSNWFIRSPFTKKISQFLRTK